LVEGWEMVVGGQVQVDVWRGWGKLVTLT